MNEPTPDDDELIPGGGGSRTDGSGVQDDDRRSETSVLVSFGLATLGAVGFVVGYGVDLDQQWLGLSLTLAFTGLGYGMVVWAHGLMPSGGEVEDRPPIAPPVAEEQEAGEYLRERGLQVGRRGMLGAAFATALGATGVAALVPALSLGRRPGDALRHTAWSGSGTPRLVTSDGRPVATDQLDVGGILTVFPDGHVGAAYAQTVLIRLGDDIRVVSPANPAWMAGGHIAYSKVCTHAGCPVGLYEATENLLFCPCHQSSFAVVEGARPLMGPATRALPQLPLGIDDDGFLVATGDFPDAVGPGWWTRP